MMKNIDFKNRIARLIVIAVFATSVVACVREELPLPEAPFPNTAEIFTDTFIGMGSNFYFPFVGDGAKPDVFSVDDTEGFESNASIRIDVPSANDPGGTFAGAVFIVDGSPRDLTAYNALTFYAKASQTATITELGLGTAQLTSVTRANVDFFTNWRKYYIPVPNPALLTEETVMFLFSAKGIGDVAGEEVGFTFWIDELKFENLSTIREVESNPLELRTIFDIDGTTVEVNAAPAYFRDADIESAPIPPVRDPSEVVSIFSDAYENVEVDNYNGFFEFATTQGGAITIGDDNIISYSNLNFVSINMFESPDVDASNMTHVHVDINVQDPLDEGDYLNFQIINNDGASSTSATIGLQTIEPLRQGQWVSYDIPLCEFVGLGTPDDVDLIFFVSDATISSILVDNVYFFVGDENDPVCEEAESVPPTEAPTAPTQAAADVISIYSDSYDDVANSGYNNYGAAVFSEVDLNGNSVLQYTNPGVEGGNFQVIELGDNKFDGSEMTNFRIDAWFSNEIPDGAAFILKVVDIAGEGDVVEGIITVTAASTPALVNGEWISFDFSFTELESLGLTRTTSIQQVVIDMGSTGEVFVDNIYFYK